MSAAAIIPCGIMRHAIYRDDRAMRLLVHLLLVIAEEEAAGAGQSPGQRGTVVRSMHELALALRWHRSKAVRAIAALRRADAIRTRTTPRGTEITCLYYSAAPQQTDAGPSMPKAAPRKKRAKPVTAPIEERRERFARSCRAAIEADPERLPEQERKAFFSYWTEPNAEGVMRFELQPFFDHGRRMDTWRRRAAVTRQEPQRGQSQTPQEFRTKWNPY